MVSTLIKTLSCLRDRRLDRALVRYLRIFVAEEDLDLLQERFSVLIERSMTCIRVHNELSVWQMLLENESVDRCHYDVFVAVNNERGMCDAFQGGVTSGGWYRSPLPDRGKLGDGRVPGQGRSRSFLRDSSRFMYSRPAAWLASEGEKNAANKNATGSACSSGDSSVKVMPSPPRGPVPTKMSFLRTSGRSSATCCPIMPPSEKPKRLNVFRPS